MHVVIQVHGTWGRNAYFRLPTAKWCEENSACRLSAITALGRDVVFNALSWSGANSTDARLKAARQLSTCLKTQHQKHPNAKLHILAHSHAGNIAMYAAKDPQIGALISSLICFSTPFLHISPRALGERLGKRLELLASIAFTTITLAMAAFMSMHIWQLTGRGLLDMLQQNIWFGIAAMAIGSSAALAARSVLIPTLHRFHADSHRYCEQMRLPDALPFPVLLIRAAGDEAAASLGAAQFWSFAFTRLVRLLSIMLPIDVSDQPKSSPDGRRLRRRLPRSMRTGMQMMGASLLITVATFFLASIGVDIRISPTLIALAIVLFFVFGVAVMVWVDLVALVVMLCIAPLCALLALSLYFFGWRRSMLTSLSMNISAESSPPGKWEVVQLGYGESSLEMQRELNHATHSAPEALAVMESWLREHFREYQDEHS